MLSASPMSLDLRVSFIPTLSPKSGDLSPFPKMKGGQFPGSGDQWSGPASGQGERAKEERARRLRRKGEEKAEEGKGLERERENTSGTEQRGGDERWNPGDDE